MLRLVNADFCDRAVVDAIVAAWARGVAVRRRKIDDVARYHGGGVDDFAPIAPSFANQLPLLLRRHAVLLSRDVIVVGVRFFCYFFGNLYFAVVYIKARRRLQSQVSNRMWLLMWHHAVPANLTVVLAIAMNFEAKLVRSEVRNGMVAPGAYIVARGLLMVPMVFVLAAVALGIPSFGVANFEVAHERFWTTSAIWVRAPASFSIFLRAAPAAPHSRSRSSTAGTRTRRPAASSSTIRWSASRSTSSCGSTRFSTFFFSGALCFLCRL